MIGSFKKEKIVFKVGSMEWLNFFGFSQFLIVIGLMFLYFEYKDNNNLDDFNGILLSLVCLLSGFFMYINQLRKLKFDKVPFKGEVETFRRKAIELLQSENWIIEYNNKEGIQAVNRDSLFSLDMITIRIFKTKVLLNVIHHPISHNSIAAHLSLNMKGKRIMKKIKASA